ncbi:hypothetical protein LguiA_030469 [Lonicera macranthoides]
MLAKAPLITPTLMSYIVGVYVVKNRKNHVSPIFMALYHLFKLKRTPFTGSIVFGEDSDGDY